MRRHLTSIALLSILASATQVSAQEAPPAVLPTASSPSEPTAAALATATNVAALQAEREHWSSQRVSLAGPTTLILLGAVTTVLGATLFRQYDSADCAPTDNNSCRPSRAFPEASKALLITGALTLVAGATWLPFRRKKRKAQAQALERIDGQLREAPPQLSVVPVIVPGATAPADFLGLVATLHL